MDGDNTVKDFGYPRECGGDPLTNLKKYVDSEVIPANAGVILQDTKTIPPLNCYPRECGGDP